MAKFLEVVQFHITIITESKAMLKENRVKLYNGSLLIFAVIVLLLLAGCISTEDLKELSEVVKEVSEEVKKESAKPNEIPSWYYKTDWYPDYAKKGCTVGEFILHYFIMPEGYTPDVFDCSEMAAYLEWALEDAGYRAVIATGYPPWEGAKSKVKHAWVLVYNTYKEPGFKYQRWIPIEGTRVRNNYERYEYFREFFASFFLSETDPGIIKPVAYTYKDYCNPEKTYESMYDVPEYLLHEFDWWSELYTPGKGWTPAMRPR